MMKWVYRGIPIPLGAIDNKRSLVSLDNLLDLIIYCIKHQKAAGQVFLASDGVDLSTTELLQALGVALGKPARLLLVPMSWLNFAFSLIGEKHIAQRLLGSLQVCINKNKQVLDCAPPVSIADG